MTTDTTPPQALPMPSFPVPDIARSLHEAFLLGWDLVELRNRILIKALESDPTTPSANSPASLLNGQENFNALRLSLERLKARNESLQFASIWRALFARITDLQRTTFPNCETARPLSDPPDKLWFLHPVYIPNYADSGIPGLDTAKTPILEKFRLFDVTRRALNSLILLHVNLEDSLIPEEIGQDQIRLTRALLTGPPMPNVQTAEGEAGQQNTAATPGTLQQEASMRDPVSDEDTAMWKPKIPEAVQKLSAWAIKFLDAWDGYLRENFYANGELADDESALIAYEAGHSLASLCWGVSVNLTPLERSGAATHADYAKAWALFNDRAIIHIQHQLSALTTVLDNAYYQQNKNVAPPPPGDMHTWPNPDLPSQTIYAVKHSLDYWMRAIKWITGTKSDTGSPIQWSTTNPTRDKQLTDRASSDTAATLSKQMRIALTEQADVWQSLLTGQQSLRGYSIEHVTQKIVQDVTDEIVGAVQQEVRDSLHQLSRSFWLAEALIGLIAVAGVFLAWLMVQHPATQNPWLAGLSGILTTGITTVSGFFGFQLTKNQKEAKKQVIAEKQTAISTATSAVKSTSTQEAGLASQVEGVLDDTRAALLSALERGYQQIRIEFALLNQSIGITAPLIEFFVLSPAIADVRSDYTFLTEIIWDGTDREQEIKEVARAAFGPFSAFLGLSSRLPSQTPTGSAIKRAGP